MAHQIADTELAQAAETFCTLQDGSAMAAALGGQAPNLADYFGIWAVYDQVFAPMVERVNRMDLRAHVADPRNDAAVRSRNERRAFDMTEDGVALIPISGPMQKSVGSLQEGTSTVRVRQQLRAAARDEAVRGAMLMMDTPGGQTKGNSDLADEVARFGQAKPIHAFAEDMVASAGVSVASQAHRITANCAGCLYGAMGTYAVVYDYSQQAEKLGVRVHVVRAGEFKGMGVPGTEITQEQLDEMQRIVDALNDQYLQMIAKGRGMPKSTVTKLADGRIHPAPEAKELGLIDGIGSFDTAYRALLGAISRPSARPATRARFYSADDDDTGDDDDEEKPDVDEGCDDDEDENMADSNTTTAASVQQLRERFPDSSAEWREEQTLAGATLEQAAISYAQHLQEENRQLREQQAKPKAKAPTGGLGADPLTLAGINAEEGESGDAVQDFNAAVAKLLPANATMQQRQQAIRTVATRNPQLHTAYLLATNAGSKKLQRQILERAEDVEQFQRQQR